jgi:hypothetical protein
LEHSKVDEIYYRYYNNYYFVYWILSLKMMNNEMWSEVKN